jgi:hypothetical protein
MRLFELALGVAFCLASPCAAQNPGQPYSLSPRLAQAVAASEAARPGTVVALHPTYWKEGAIVGGILGGALGALAGGGFCGQSDAPHKNCTGSTILGGMAGALILRIPGALIGGLFPKRQT